MAKAKGFHSKKMMIEKENTVYFVNADVLTTRILEELPEKRGEAYYALSMVLEMIESEKEPYYETDAFTYEACDNAGCEDCCECGVPPEEDAEESEWNHKHFCLTVEADGLNDLRSQLCDACSYTHSDDLHECLSAFDSFEYDSESGVTTVNIEDRKL